MYFFHYTSKYKRSIKRYRNNIPIKNRIYRTLSILKIDPFDPRLRTHKAMHKTLGVINSSKVSGDIRIIWILKDNKIILLSDIGGHEGKAKVYK